MIKKIEHYINETFRGNLRLPSIFILLVFVTILGLSAQGLAFDDRGYQGYMGYLQRENDHPSAWTSVSWESKFTCYDLCDPLGFPLDCDVPWGTTTVTHDRDHWYIYSGETYSPPGGEVIWKIPIETDIEVPFYNTFLYPQSYLYLQMLEDRGISTVTLDQFTALDALGAKEFGDMATYEFLGTTYLFVEFFGRTDPVVDQSDRFNSDIAGICVINADTMEYVAVNVFPIAEKGLGLAFSSSGILHRINSAEIITLDIDWNLLHTQQILSLQERESRRITSSEGNPLNTPTSVLSCDLTPDDNFLFVSFYHSYWDTPIWVIDVNSATRESYSINSSHGEEGPFDVWGKSIGTGVAWDRLQYGPLGLTIWDLNADQRAPNISGQLHVIVGKYDPNTIENSSWSVRMSHFTNKVHVDHSYVEEEKGIPGKPFNTVMEGIDYAWDHSVLKITSGSYNEAIVIDKQLKIELVDGPVIIGK